VLLGNRQQRTVDTRYIAGVRNSPQGRENGVEEKAKENEKRGYVQEKVGMG
jgi:hypothetical protein